MEAAPAGSARLRRALDAEEDLCEVRYLGDPSPVTARALLRAGAAELDDDREIAARHGLTL
jgi:hypothetical protein